MLLTDSTDGRPVRVLDVREHGPSGRRLMELGLITGALIQVLGRAPLGDPLRVRVGDFDLSLRLGDAANVVVESA